MEKQIEERSAETIRQKGEEVKKYKSRERNDFINAEDIIGLDANVLVDLIESQEFKREIKLFVELNVLKIYTTNIALGEAKHVLIKKRNYLSEKANEILNNIIREFNLEVVRHNTGSNETAEQWVDKVKNKMFISKFNTFPNDMKILSALYRQGKINIYITEDTNIEKAVKILNLPIRVKIIGEASNISGQKISEFFKEKHRVLRRKHKLF